MLYGQVIPGIVLVIPRARLSAVSGFTDVYSAVAGVLHSSALNALFAVLVILTLVGSGLVWLEGADRTQAIAALDGSAPAWMGRFASFGTPIAVNLTSGVTASVMCILVFVVSKGSLASFFAVMLALTISTTAQCVALLWERTGCAGPAEPSFVSGSFSRARGCGGRGSAGERDDPG